MASEDFSSLILKGRRSKLFDLASLRPLDLGSEAIKELLLHREPFLLLDRVTAVDPDGLSAAGTRRIDPLDPVFRGHFPQVPVYPGVLLLEIIGQLGLCLLGLADKGSLQAAPAPRQVRIVKIHHAVFLNEVKPGDDLIVLAKVVESDELTATCAGQIIKGDTICAFALVEVYFVEA
jgi:3-hydroxyacyl-[acyl-carrier-protein] dehydratase